MSTALPDPACQMAHGSRPSPVQPSSVQPSSVQPRTLVAVFSSPVASHLLHFARDLGYATVLVDPAVSPDPTASPDPTVSPDPDGGRRAGDVQHADRAFASLDSSFVDPATDIVVTDHDRPELGEVLREALDLPARWIGVMGSPRHTAPHVAALRRLGVAEADIIRIHRPIGLNIGSRTPAEIAVATLAGLIADRNGRPGGFSW